MRLSEIVSNLHLLRWTLEIASAVLLVSIPLVFPSIQLERLSWWSLPRRRVQERKTDSTPFIPRREFAPLGSEIHNLPLPQLMC